MGFQKWGAGRVLGSPGDHVWSRAGSISIIFIGVDYRFFSIIFDDFGFDVDFFYNRDFDYFFAVLYLGFRTT
jgi:hypothetical protein